MSNENSPIPAPSKTVFGLSEKVFLASQAALISLLVAALATLGGNHPAWAAGGRSQVAGLEALGLLGRGAQFCAS